MFRLKIEGKVSGGNYFVRTITFHNQGAPFDSIRFDFGGPIRFGSIYETKSIDILLCLRNKTPICLKNGYDIV